MYFEPNQLNRMVNMVALTEKIYQEALDLPTSERLELVDLLLHSTNIPTNKKIDEAWCEVVKDRGNSSNSTYLSQSEVEEKIAKRFSK
jgi:hypothetical protein